MHRLGDEHPAYAWDRATPPALTVAPGDTVELQVRDAADGQLDPTSTDVDVAELDEERANPITGPVAVDGARPGDSLVVHIEEVSVETWGWTAVIPEFGLLAEDFPDPRLAISRIRSGEVAFGTTGLTLPLRPFIGTIGVAPAEHTMIEWLVRHHDLAPVDAYLLCSVIADLRIREVVDAPNWVVSLDLPLDVMASSVVGPGICATGRRGSPR